MHTKHTGIQFVFSGKCAFSHQRIRYRRIDGVCKFAQFFCCSGSDRTTAHENEWFFCLADQFCCLIQVRFQHLGSIRSDRCRLLISIFCNSCCHIFCHIYKYRTRSSALCNGKCTSDRRCKVMDIFYDHAVFGDRHNNAGDINLLEAVTSEKSCCHVSCDRYHRDRIHMGCRDTGYQIGCSRTGGCHTYTYSSGSTGISVSSMGSTLLMRCEYMVDLIAVFI